MHWGSLRMEGLFWRSHGSWGHYIRPFVTLHVVNRFSLLR